jgi:hypothetical protein
MPFCGHRLRGMPFLSWLLLSARDTLSPKRIVAH